MLPLSFSEFLDFNGFDATCAVASDREAWFNRYLEYGGFPGLTELLPSSAAAKLFVRDIYSTIIMKDVILRHNIRDPSLLDSLVRFLCANVGNIVSTKSVSDYLTSAGRKTSSETIDNYIRMLESAFFLYRARRYDLKGKLHLKTNEKFYIVDTGIRHALIGGRGDYGFLLENVVYFELLRRGYQVSIGKQGELEVDFVAVKPEHTVYIQVTATMLDATTRERELAPLNKINDNYEKLILSMDRTPITDFAGVRNVNLLDFLLLTDVTQTYQ